MRRIHLVSLTAAASTASLAPREVPTRDVDAAEQTTDGTTSTEAGECAPPMTLREMQRALDAGHDHTSSVAARSGIRAVRMLEDEIGSARRMRRSTA